MGFKQFLLEKTFNLDKDVDMIWNKYFKDIVKQLEKDADKVLGNMSTGEYVYAQTDSGTLKSADAKKAHEVNPVKIKIGILRRGNAYNWKDELITLSINKQAVDVLRYMTKDMVMDEYPLWIREFDPEQIKSVIAHELSHWISDSLHNRHIKKRVTGNAGEYQKMINKMGDVNASYFEIDAQIHAIKELKRQHKDEWDELTFIEMMKMKPASNNMIKNLQKAGKKVFTGWIRKLFSRMVREDLLGKNMQPITFGEYKA